MGAAKQARRRRRGRAVRGLDDRPRNRRHPPDRCRFPRLRGLWSVDVKTSTDTDTHVYAYADLYTYAYTAPCASGLSLA